MTPRPDLGSLADEDLLRRFRDGEPAALAVIVERYKRPLFNFILRSTGDRDRSEELLQDVFVRVVEKSSDFKGDSKLSTWLYTIARNLCIDLSRKMVFRRHKSLDAPAAGSESDGPTLGERVAAHGAGADRETIGKQLGTKLAAAVESLPDEQREVFLMREVQQLAFKEIADVVGAPENTVKSRMRYALERLREALAEYEDYARENG